MCGFLHGDFAPWGDEGRTPSYVICECCGVEYGYEDSLAEGVARYRAEWLAKGAPWFDAGARPPGWSLARQLEGLPDLPAGIRAVR
ncbi:MAG TPA: hypothetical protein VF530_08440 [Planctomycetota bacterium]